MRFIYVIFLFLFGVSQAAAQAYVEPTLTGVLDLIYVDGLVDLSQDDQVRDYLKVKDCDALKQADTDEFKWQAIKKTTQDKADSEVRDVKRQFKIPMSLKINNYNFDTLAFDINPDSQLKAVRFLQFYNVAQVPCRTSRDYNTGFSRFSALPQDYQIELEAPFSVYRLPVAEALGKRILEELEKDEEGNRMMYLAAYITVDTMDRITKVWAGKVAVGIGRIDRIDFFVDQARTRRFKTLYPSLD
jgi:hypothetical protein